MSANYKVKCEHVEEDRYKYELFVNDKKVKSGEESKSWIARKYHYCPISWGDGTVSASRYSMV